MGRFILGALYMLLAGLDAGCDVVPPETRDPGPAPTERSQPPAAAPNADTDATSPLAGSDVLPTPTIGKSSGDSTRSTDDQPILSAVRTGQSRLVFEFDGAGLPAWQVEYVDQPVLDCGSGEPVTVAGDAWLQIHFVGAQAHTDAGEATSGPRQRAVNQPVLRELARICDFEGHVTWVAGLASPNPYAPRVLEAPSRLVIDIVVSQGNGVLP